MINVNERCKTRQTAIMHNIENKNKILIAIKNGASWFSEVQEKAGIKSLKYFRQALYLARKEGCIDVVTTGKYCIHKEVFIMKKTEAQLEREKETGMVMSKRFDKEKGVVIIEGTIYKEIDPATLGATVETMQKQLVDTQEAVTQFEVQVTKADEVQMDASLDEWMANSLKAETLAKKVAAERQLEERKKDLDLIKSDLNELLEILKQGDVKDDKSKENK